MSRFAEHRKINLFTRSHLVSSSVKFHSNYLGARVTPDAKQQGPLSWSDCLQFPGETERWHAESEGVSQIIMAPVGAPQRHVKISNRYNFLLQKPHMQNPKQKFLLYVKCHFGLFDFRNLAPSFFFSFPRCFEVTTFTLNETEEGKKLIIVSCIRITAWMCRFDVSDRNEQNDREEIYRKSDVTSLNSVYSFLSLVAVYDCQWLARYDNESVICPYGL